MNDALEHYTDFIETTIYVFISELNTQLGIADSILLDTWKKIKDRGTGAIFDHKGSSKSNPKEAHKECEAKIKSGPRKNQNCGKNVSKSSKTGRFCTAHLKQEDDQSEESKDDESDGIIFKKNSYGNYAFGNTGLILKSGEDHRIIGKQKQNGTIIDLSEDDIKLCQQRRLAYVANYHADLEKQHPVNINTIQFTSQMAFI